MLRFKVPPKSTILDQICDIIDWRGLSQLKCLSKCGRVKPEMSAKPVCLSIFQNPAWVGVPPVKFHVATSYSPGIFIEVVSDLWIPFIVPIKKKPLQDVNKGNQPSTSVDKTVSLQGPFRSCSGGCDHTWSSPSCHEMPSSEDYAPEQLVNRNCGRLVVGLEEFLKGHPNAPLVLVLVWWGSRGSGPSLLDFLRPSWDPACDLGHSYWNWISSSNADLWPPCENKPIQVNPFL